MLLNRARATRTMAAAGLDMILLADPRTFLYATDFTAPSTFSFLDRPFLALVGPERVQAIVPSWDYDDFRARSWVTDVLGYTEFATDRDGDLLPSWRVALDRWLPRTGRLGIEERYLPVWIREALTELRPDLQLVDAQTVVRDIRTVKTSEEIARVRIATAAMEGAVGDMFAAAHDGITEAEMGRIYATGVASRGCENIANFVLGFGPGGAVSHAIPGDRKLTPGDAIRFDLGARYRGYHADTAVTRLWKQMSPAQETLYRGVLDSQRAAADLLCAGRPVRELYDLCIRTARDWIPTFRMEHVGHGLGVEHHENPPLIGTGTATLEADMMINVETLFLDPVHGGFAIEDTYLVTETGAEKLTGFDRTPVLMPA
ncbi:M24 family metallopeptidase [Acidimangrovimonas sediminis]|uniref:M24 family metallopeptidase n=1 Tax=Acidimangrovimonas sediminis TaxID=2056283 RepID=UPI000C80A8B3|nr:Xaa-Pro peptidase family protein [Acidimangrovimonas sediminis]